MATAYSQYRLLFTKNSNNDIQYITINEFGLYGDVDHSGANLCLGATASADGVYGSQVAAYAIDGVPGTYWESALAGSTKELKVVLSSAVVVRSLYLSSVSQSSEVPRDFSLQGSNDGSVWEPLISFTGWDKGLVARSAYSAIGVKVGGVSKLETDVATTRVLVHDWVSGELIASVTPSLDGAWVHSLSDFSDVLVTHIGPSGFRPQSDGPITPFVW